MLKPQVDQILPPLTIETIVNGGSGLARYAGQVVFVPHTAVGDRIVSRVTKVKKHFLEAELVEILESGPQRIVPHCPVAGECGGCQWQHLPYSEQLKIKEGLFSDTLVRKCGVDPALVREIVSSPQPWHYRSRVQVKCHQAAERFETGFYRPKSRFVVAVDRCPLIDTRLNDTLSVLRRLLDGTSFARYIPQMDLAVGDDGVQSVVVHYLGDDADGLQALLLGSGLAGHLHLQLGSKASMISLQGNGRLAIEVDEPALNLCYATGSFAQINLEQNRALVREAMKLIDWQGGETVLDLYCGMGNFSLPAARRGGTVLGVEESELSIRMARVNAQANGLKNASFVAAPAQGYVARHAAGPQPDIIFLDPPRVGAHEVVRELINASAQWLVYVSCDPQTLARDLNILLNNGWRLISSQPFDMFPQTYHCESLTLMQRVACI